MIRTIPGGALLAALTVVAPFVTTACESRDPACDPVADVVGQRPRPSSATERLASAGVEAVDAPDAPALIAAVVDSASSEPVFHRAAGDVMIYEDNMDAYVSPHCMDTPSGRALRPFYPDENPRGYAVITPDRDGVGKGLRLVYHRGGGERLIWKTDPEDNAHWYEPANAAFVVQYWFRISKNGGPGGGPGFNNTAVGMKWIEFWRVGMSDRTQFGVTAGDPLTGPLWHVNAAGKGPFGYQPGGPYWNQVNDNRWHRATYLYQPSSGLGATDGIARMWIDGTKIVDVSATAAGSIPAGHTRPWSTMGDVAALDSTKTGTINLGEYMNGKAGDGVTDLPMTLDFDDFKWWKLPTRVR